STSRREDLLRLEDAAVVETRPDDALLIAVDAIRRHSQSDVDSRLAEAALEQFADEGLFPPEQSAARDEHDVRAEARIGRGHFDADDSSADDDQPRRDLLGRCRFACAPGSDIRETGD